ncbi:MMPL family transporter [Streptomyces sp. NPDC017529]|uniref:MMPL family transporter n=1 Tax=Streptomyces sp. NPDC017529 TaxID=3365000 RepID=UPI0037B2452A
MLLAALAVPAALSAEDRMTAEQFVARTEAERADRLLDEQFSAGNPHMAVLASSTSGVDAAASTAAGQALTARLERLPEVAEVRSYWNTHQSQLRSADGRTGLLLVRLRGDDAARTATAERLMPDISGGSEGPLRLAATGEAVVEAALKVQMQQDLVHAEAIVAPAALVLLILVFGSVVAAVLPLLVGALTVLGSMAALHGIARFLDVSVFSLNLVTAVGLGLAIDYSLFITTRFREQLALGDGVPSAVRTAVRTAGRTVWFSALTVAFAFAAPLVFPSMRSLAYAGIIVTLIAAVVATTVLPATLAVAGTWVTRLDPLSRWHRSRPPTRLDRGFWHRLTLAVMRRPAVIAVAVVSFLVFLAAPFIRAEVGLDDDRALPAGHAVHTASERLRADFSEAATSPVNVVLVGYKTPASGRDSRLGTYAARVSAVPGIRQVIASQGVYSEGRRVAGLEGGSGTPHPDAQRRIPQGQEQQPVADGRFMSAAGTRLQVDTDVEPYSSMGTSLVKQLRALPAPAPALVGGESARLVDTTDELLGRMPWALAIIGGTTLVLLFLFTGSVLIPIKAIVLNLLSLTATFGSLVFIFQEGHLQWLVGDFNTTGYVDVGMPILIFCVAFGLSMDYEVFLLSRISEEHALTGENNLAVARGLQRTGRLITAAAALFAAVLVALATSGVSSLKMLGIGLALAVVLDATLVRALLVPALMRLLGRANWWAPPKLRRFATHWRHGG